MKYFSILDSCIPWAGSKSTGGPRVCHVTLVWREKVIVDHLNLKQTNLTHLNHSFDEHIALDSLERNRISNISFAVQSAFELIILAVMVGILKGMVF